MEGNKETNDIKIFRLHTGEDVITEYEETENGVIIINPMVVMRNDVKKAYMMSPLLPYKILEDNVTILYSNDIQFIMVPNETIINYYLSVVEQVELDMFNSYIDNMTTKSNNNITMH